MHFFKFLKDHVLTISFMEGFTSNNYAAADSRRMIW